MSRSASAPHWIRTSLNRWSLLGVLLGAGAGFVMLTFTMGSKVRFASYNWLFALRRPVPITEAVVVYLDEQAHFELKQPLNAAWDRSLHARLIDRLTRAGARAVVFDIVFLDTGRGPSPSDEALAAAARTNGHVIVGANPRHDPGQIEIAVDLPYDALRDAIDDRWGLVEIDPERDAVVRRHPPSYPPFKHSLSWVTAAHVGAAITRGTNDAAVARAATAGRWINYYGPAYTLPHCNFAEALDPARVPDSFFTNRVVFVGASTLTHFSGDRKDAYLSPVSQFANRIRAAYIAGVEVQATCALNLIRGDWLQSPSDPTSLWISIALGVATGFGFVNLRPRAATLVFLGVVALITLAALVAFNRHRLWTPWLVWIDQAAITWFFAIAVNSYRLHLQNRLLEQTIASYVGRKLARKYIRERNHDFLKPGARKQDLTILFSDIADFTAISEGMDSNALANHMNVYFEGAVGQCIHPTDGTVVKYIGDAIFAFWNAPDPQADHAERACEAAIRFRTRPADTMNGRPLITRIGLHTGAANVGNFGSSTRVDYTALGENINLASRMEGLNKHLGTLTLLTGETQALVAAKYATRPLGRFVLKGFERHVDVYELEGRIEDAARFRARDTAFATALQHFQAGQFAEAADQFAKLAEPTTGDPDGPSEFYRIQARHLALHPPAPGWQGEVELHEK